MAQKYILPGYNPCTIAAVIMVAFDTSTMAPVHVIPYQEKSGSQTTHTHFILKAMFKIKTVYKLEQQHWNKMLNITGGQLTGLICATTYAYFPTLL